MKSTGSILDRTNAPEAGNPSDVSGKTDVIRIGLIAGTRLGSLNLVALGRLKQQLRLAIASGQNIAIDLSAVETLGATAIGMIVRTARTLHECGRTLWVINDPLDLLEICRISGMLHVTSKTAPSQPTGTGEHDFPG